MPRPVSYRTCAICARPTVSPWSPYCARCRGHLYNRPENAKRRAALIAAYDPSIDASSPVARATNSPPIDMDVREENEINRISSSMIVGMLVQDSQTGPLNRIEETILLVIAAAVLTVICVIVGKWAMGHRDRMRAVRRDHLSPRRPSWWVLPAVLDLVGGVCCLSVGAIFLYFVAIGLPRIGLVAFFLYAGTILSIMGLLFIIVSYYSVYIEIE